MIVPMLKLTLLIPSGERTALLEGLQRLGCVEIESSEERDAATVAAAHARSVRYDRARGHFHVWLARAAGYRIDDLLRRNARRNAREVQVASTPGNGSVPGPAMSAEAPDEVAALFEEEWLDLLRRRALERLRAAVSLRQFELFHAAVVEEWPTEKVMQTFGASRAAVYQAKHRLAPLWRDALRAVRDELDAPPDIPPAPAAATPGNAP